MIRTNLFDDSDAKCVIARNGRYSVIEYEKDLSVSPQMAQEAYFASEMNVRKRQVVVELSGPPGVYVQSRAMQMMLGNMEAATDVKSAGDLVRKFIGSRVTGETTIKPLYWGDGTLVLEPTYKFIILQDMKDWPSGMIIEDGMFLACDATIDLEIAARNTMSSLIFGNEGIFNTALRGVGVVALESPVPMEELIVVDLVDDQIKIDGNMAIAWSPSLRFTVEKTTSTLIGSFASGEGFVNTYTGTGRVLVAPVRKNKHIATPEK